jgi:2-octaprenylphenol hydroxylase
MRAGLEDGRELRGTLIVGADGTESKTRQLLGIETAGHAYHQDALVAHVRTASRTPTRLGSVSSHRSAGLPALVGRPLLDRVEHEPRRGDAPACARPAGLWRGADRRQRRGAGSVHGCSAARRLPAAAAIRLAYARPRAVLLGDAAHVVHPLAGQGLNLGLLDCATLAQVLEDCGGARNFGDMKVLRRYERWRRSENLLAGAALDGWSDYFRIPAD